MSAERFELARFTSAQEDGGTYAAALAELRAGHKRSHWIWFVFPQLTGLGHSPTARRYGIGSLAEAEAYVRDPLLGARLCECAAALLAHRERDVRQILGATDSLKLRSSMTLFARAAPGEPLFGEVLGVFFDGAPDPETERLLAGSGPG